MDDEVTELAYLFHFADAPSIRIALRFARDTYQLLYDAPNPPEAWTALDFNKCGHCPLASSTAPICPFAAALSTLLREFRSLRSYENTIVEVTCGRRTVVARGALHDGTASLLGLIGATSGCPHLAVFRPMARFHLPFATEEETLFRAFSAHVLEKLVRGEPASLDGMRERYEAAGRVNVGMAERLRAAFPGDAVVNGLIILDTFAQAAPYVIAKKLGELRYIFERGTA